VPPATRRQVLLRDQSGRQPDIVRPKIASGLFELEQARVIIGTAERGGFRLPRAAAQCAAHEQPP
jgi:hypothetical protein